MQKCQRYFAILSTTIFDIINIMSKNIKPISLAVLLFIESFLLTQLIISYIKTVDYFKISTGFSIQVIGLMFLTIITCSLTIGAWGKWKQYVLISVPVTLAMFLALLNYNFYNALTISTAALLLLSYDIYKSDQLKGILVKMDPRFILRFSNTGLLFIFSVLGGVLVIIHSTYYDPNINLGKKLVEVSEQPIQQLMKGQNVDKTVMVTVEKQINDLVEPYKNWLKPLMGLVVFGIFQFFSNIAYLIYMVAIGPIFKLAKKSGFIKVEKIKIEKENFTF